MNGQPPESAAPSHLSTLEEWLHWLETLHPKKIDLSLERIKAVLAALGLQAPSYRVITIGGTNGKGSCVALLESIYREAGYRVGAFTSPHLWRFNERIRLGGEPASGNDIIEHFTAIDRARGEITLSYFEYSALAALVHFACSGAEVALLEVGLGGRLDAVNALDADAALVVSVSLDHQAWLGTTREAIGHEKAGILRGARPAVVADRQPPQSVLAHAERLGAELSLIGRDFDYEIEPDGQTWRFWNSAGEHRALPRPGFGGREQYANGAGCLAVVETLQGPLPVDAAAIRNGLGGARLGGRVDRREFGGVQWIFDVAHNPAAATALATELQGHAAAGRTFAVVAIMGDKDLAGVLSPVAPFVNEWLLTRADGERGAQPEELLAALENRGRVAATICLDIAAACEEARLKAVPGDRVLVFGSFYLVGPAMAALGLYSAPSQPGNVSASKWTGV